jgi:hypothetical protein
MLKAITLALRALVAYIELKKERFAHDVIEQSRSKISIFEEKLEDARDLGLESDAQYADRLRHQILAEKEHLKRISAIYFESKSG